MVKFDNVGFGYNSNALFKGLSFELKESNIYGLLGLNGAGKSSLLRLISGQLFLKSGTISVLGENPARRSPEFLREIFYLPEEQYLPACSGADYIKLNSPFYPNFNYQFFKDTLQLMGMDNILESKLTKLSFGQKRKFLIAFALATNVKLLLLDEPTNGLDIPTKDIVRKVIAGGLGADQIIIISTHQVRDLERLMDPLLILHKGEMLFNGNQDDLDGKYSFRMGNENSIDAKTIYSETIPGGYAILEEGSGKPTPDLEFLFKTFVLTDGRFSEYLKKLGAAK